MQHVLDRFTLRSSLLLDAAVSGVTGLLLLAGAGPLHRSLDLPTVFLRVSGAILVPFVIVLIVLGAQDHPARSEIRSMIALNLLWTAGSFIVLLSGQIEPNRPQRDIRHLSGGRRRSLCGAAIRGTRSA